MRPLQIVPGSVSSPDIYPNPAGDIIVISNIMPGKRITVYDQTGKIKYEEKVLSDKIILNVQSWTKGTYCIRYGNSTALVIIR